MSEINATITAYHTRSGTSGAGEPVFAEITLAHAIPCVLLQRRRRRVESETAEGVEPEWRASVRLAAMTAAGITPEPDHRITIARTAPSTLVETFDVLAVDDDGVAMQLDLRRRHDGAEGGA